MAFNAAHGTLSTTANVAHAGVSLTNTIVQTGLSLYVLMLVKLCHPFATAIGAAAKELWA